MNHLLVTCKNMTPETLVALVVFCRALATKEPQDQVAFLVGAAASLKEKDGSSSSKVSGATFIGETDKSKSKSNKPLKKANRTTKA